MPKNNQVPASAAGELMLDRITGDNLWAEDLKPTVELYLVARLDEIYG